MLCSSLLFFISFYVIHVLCKGFQTKILYESYFTIHLSDFGRHRVGFAEPQPTSRVWVKECVFVTVLAYLLNILLCMGEY